MFNIFLALVAQQKVTSIMALNKKLYIVGVFAIQTNSKLQIEQSTWLFVNYPDFGEPTSHTLRYDQSEIPTDDRQVMA